MKNNVNDFMNLDEFSTRLAKRLSTNQDKVDVFIKLIVNYISSALICGDKVEIRNLFSMRIKMLPNRDIGTSCQRAKVSFKPSSALIKNLNVLKHED